MGNAEYSAFSALSSRFYNMFGLTYRYQNFSTSSIYIETGILGLIGFIFAYVALLFNVIKHIRNKYNAQKEQIYYEYVGMGALLTIIVFLFYNNLQRTDCAFILNFFAAIPFAISKNSHHTCSIIQKECNSR